MPDVLTPTQRHRCMTHTQQGDETGNGGEEMAMGAWVSSQTERKSVPGKPDIVMRRYRTAIFVNGCFWHGHEGCGKFVMPKSNTEFWQAKIDRNRARDQRNYDELMHAGWQVIVIWECNLAKDKHENTMQQVAYVGIFL